ncbi:hypothetical protein [Streptomyces sp. NPDC007172]|uniref:hypothetical protein n=1 Tax=Streptomyces sp. NPDC007172 TaxID=3364776 RepID=UPI00368489CD
MADDPTLRVSDYGVHDLWDWPRLWFSKGDGDAVKQKINGLSLGLDYVKIALTGVALGFTPIKLDVTGFKLDEKGISIAGVTRMEWPWLKEGRKFREFLRGEKGRLEDQEEAEKKERKKQATETLRKDVGRAHSRIDKLERSTGSQRRRVETVAAGPNASSGNPKNIKSAALQIKELENRLNSLITALG